MDIFIHLHFYSSLRIFRNHRILKLIREAYIKNCHTTNNTTALPNTPNQHSRFPIFKIKGVIFTLPKFRIFFFI